MFENTEIKDYSSVGYELPAQAIPTSQKGSTWIKSNLNALENIALRQITNNRQKYESTFRLLDGLFNYEHILNSSTHLSESDFLRSQAGTEKTLINYGFIEPIVNTLIGEFLETPNPSTIEATDPLSKNDYIDVKTDKLWEAVLVNIEDRLNKKMLRKGINPFQFKFQTEEEQQAYVQQIEQYKSENTPQEIEKKMNQSWRAVYIEWVEAVIREDESRFDFDVLDRKNLYSYLATGKCFRHIRAGYDYYTLEYWDIKDTFYDNSVEYIEDGDYAGRLKNLTPNQVIQMFGHKLSFDEQQRILKSKNYKGAIEFSNGGSINSFRDWAEKGGGEVKMIPHPSYYPYLNAKYIQDATGLDLGMTDLFNPSGVANSLFDYEDNRTDKIRVLEAYWVSEQIIMYLYLEDENGNITSEIVTDEVATKYLAEKKIKNIKTKSIEQHEKNPEPNTVVWATQPVTHYGIKICKQNTDLQDDLYIDGYPVEYQLKGDSNMYHTKIPVVGINEKTSFVSRIEQEQIDYNIHLNIVRDLQAKEIGLFFLFDLASLPTWIKDMGGEESVVKALDLARESGFLPIDGDPRNSKSSFNQFQAVNMDLTQAMLGKMQMAREVKAMALEKLGVTPERLYGASQRTATGIEQSLRASHHQTAGWFNRYSNFQKRYTEIHVNMAQYLKKDGVDGSVLTTDSDMVRKFINMSDPYLPLRKFRITYDNNPKRKSELETIKQVFMNDNTIEKTLEDLAEVLSSDSVSKVLQIARYKERIKQINIQKQREFEQNQLQQEIASKKESEMLQKEWESQEATLDRQVQIYKAQLVALGFDKEKDSNANGISDIIDVGNAALENMKFANVKRQQEIDNQINRDKTENEKRVKERELYIEEKKLEIEKYKADNDLKISIENKTDAELKAQGKLKK
jgi:hypothetical protein